jgi:Zn-dependent peptidase ImmA (M78 family)/DNA-binding XRE family transcriptional regulator
MAHSIPAYVKGVLLTWARRTSGKTVDDAARSVGIDRSTLLAWENNRGRPTIAELRKLGEIYKRPIAVFYLPEPPSGFDAQREFRRLPGVSAAKESLELRLALRRALYRREAAAEIYSGLHETPPSLKEGADPTEDPEVVGARIRRLLSVAWTEQLAWLSPSGALNGWREAVENLGVLVFQTGRVSLEEMRGISITHGPLPVILLNNADSPHGRIFSLLHEFAHILLAIAGHETSAMSQRASPIDFALERTSNVFAAAALMPQKEFLATAANFPQAIVGDDAALLRFADEIKVSPEAILRRLVSLQKAPVQLYREKRRQWRRRPWFPRRKAKGGAPVEVRIIANAGKPFVGLVLEGYRRSKVSAVDVSDYLGVQLKYLDRVSRQLAEGPASAA